MKKIFFMMLALICLVVSANALCYNPTEGIENDQNDCYKARGFEELINLERKIQLPQDAMNYNFLTLSTIVSFNLMKKQVDIAGLTSDSDSFFKGRLSINSIAKVPDINNSSRTIFGYMEAQIRNDNIVSYLDKDNSIIVVYMFDKKYFYFYDAYGKTVSYLKKEEFLGYLSDKRYFRLETYISVK